MAGSVAGVAGPGAPPPEARQGPALDELMLAMDVVDTLRHQERVALRELAQDDRDEALKERLRRLYESQGIEVSDRILDEGLRALKENRFVYRPTPPGLGRTLAGLWIRRRTVAAVLGVLVALVLAWAGWSGWQRAEAAREAEAARVEVAETLPRQLEAAVAAASDAARTNDARQRIAESHAEGAAALARGDATSARVAVDRLNRLREALVQTYVLRIVSRPGEKSGVYRIPDANAAARNYYLVVEPVAEDGRVLSFPVRNEETGRTEVVSTWGVRVPKSTYDAVRDDKLDDGILQNDVLAEKPRGALEPVYAMPVSGGAITAW